MARPLSRASLGLDGADFRPASRAGGWALSPSDPTRAKPPVPTLHGRPRGVLVQSSSKGGLCGYATKPSEIHGAANATVINHHVWQGKASEPRDGWAHRTGFGQSSGYLRRVPSLPEEARMSTPVARGRLLAHSASESTMRTTSVGHGGTTDDGAVVPMTLSLSMSTIRLTEHPIAWSRRRREQQLWRRQERPLTATAFSLSSLDVPSTAAISTPVSRPASPAPLCCTYGLHPAWDRRSNSRQPGGRGRAEQRDSRAAGRPPESPPSRPHHSMPSRQVPSRPLTSPGSERRLWRGSARPFPQDRAFII